MKYSPCYQLFPDEQQREQLSWTMNVVRQVYNDALKRFTGRDWNAAANVLKRGLEQLGVGHSEVTPAETATAVSTDGGDVSVVVDASGVVESGSPAFEATVPPVA